ncbi:hypothetical protein GCM10027048_03120 [Hymenobacter coalescens]
MQRVFFATAALLLPACAPRPSATDATAAGVEVRLQAEAETAYNIVWLRATVANRGTRPVRLLNYADTVETACSPPASLQVLALTPAGDSAAFCQRCPAPPAGRRYVTLRPGQELTTRFQVDFNRVLPRAVLDTARSCRRYNNRTLGAYQFSVRYLDGRTTPARSLPVVVHRKQ